MTIHYLFLSFVGPGFMPQAAHDCNTNRTRGIAEAILILQHNLGRVI